MTHRDLTRAEEQVMRILWKIRKGYLKDIVDGFPHPRPAYTTVSTVVRVLVRKKFIAFKTYGKINEYYPLVSRTDDFRRKLKPMITNYFDGSKSELASFFVDNHLNLSELEEVRSLIEEKIRKLKRGK